MVEDGGTDRGDCYLAMLSESGSLQDNNVKSGIKNHSIATYYVSVFVCLVVCV